MKVFAVMFFSLGAAITMDLTVCDCSDPVAHLLKFSDDDCDIPKVQTAIETAYKISTSVRGASKFKGFLCSRWKNLKTIPTDLLNLHYVSTDREPLDTTPSECKHMIESKRCDTHDMQPDGSRWSFTKEPVFSPVWMTSVTYYQINCAVEELLLFQEEEGKPFNTPVGIADPSNDSITHNHMTLIWDSSLTAKIDHKPIELLMGNGLLYNTTRPHVYRLMDEDNQLDLHIEASSDCKENTLTCTRKNVGGTTVNECVEKKKPCYIQNFNFTIIGENNLFVKLIPNDQRIKPKKKTIQDLPITITENSHLQFIRDTLVQQDNELAHSIAEAQCDLRRLKHLITMSTAQFNGWMAASMLNLPICTKLSAVGPTLIAQKCKPIQVKFETEVTKCGPQPRFKNFTVNQDGWELVQFKPCFWSSGLVNFNGHPYRFTNKTWEQIEPEIIVPDRDLAHTFRFKDEKTFNYVHRSNPSYADTVVNYGTVLADIVATFNEHQEWKFGENILPSADTFFVTPPQKTSMLQTISFVDHLKIILLVAFSLVIGLICCRCFCLCGLFDVIFRLFTFNRDD